MPSIISYMCMPIIIGLDIDIEGRLGKFSETNSKVSADGSGVIDKYYDRMVAFLRN